MNYIIQKKINIKTLQIIAMFLLVFILPNTTYADNLYGQSCGTKKCNQDEVCQKQYRGVLPIGQQNDGNATYTCVKPQRLEAPDSPYKGVQTACGGVFQKAFGLDLSSLTGTVLTNTLQAGLGIIQSTLGLNGIAFGWDSRGPQSLNFGNVGLNWSIDPTNLINTDASYFQEFVPKCDSAYNNIKGVINTNFLVAPLPVDIFNPLPLPVNVTSPTPLPVVVVDDLALYQQKELIDAPLAAQQKAQTIATISDTFRTQISNDNLMPQNLDDLRKLGIQFGALDSETGVITKDAIDTYGDYANFSLDKNEELAQYFRDLQDPTKSQLPKETFTEKCGNIKLEEADTLDCIVEGLKTNNNVNDIASTIGFMASQKSDEARTKLEQEVVVMGEGYFSKTENNDKNPFTKVIQTPGSNIASLSEKVTEATIDQAIVASGDNCFESIPKNILEGTLKPVLTQGLYGVDNTLSSVLNTVSSNPVDSLQNPQGFANQLQAGVTGALPDPNRFFQSLQNSLVQNITSGLSCEINKKVSGLLAGIIGDLTLPGIGNVSGAISNAATGTVNNLVNDGVNSLIP